MAHVEGSGTDDVIVALSPEEVEVIVAISPVEFGAKIPIVIYCKRQRFASAEGFRLLGGDFRAGVFLFVREEKRGLPRRGTSIAGACGSPL